MDLDSKKNVASLGWLVGCCKQTYINLCQLTSNLVKNNENETKKQYKRITFVLTVAATMSLMLKIKKIQFHSLSLKQSVLFIVTCTETVSHNAQDF